MLNIEIDLITAFRHFSLIFGSMVLSFIIVMISASPFAKLLKKLKLVKTIRESSADGKTAELFRKLHLKKTGTPNMGGILIWGTVLLIVLISPLFVKLGFTRFSLINRSETYLPLFTLVIVALLGALDDYLNTKGTGKTKGLKVKPKFLWLTLFGLLGGLWFHFKLGYDVIAIPGFGNFEIGWWYIPLFTFIIVASANAVNITDGLDGLAAGLTAIAFLALGVIAYLHGLVILTAFCGLIVGATVAFLWFNVPPPMFFMGDTGALSLGATMGVIAMLTNSVIILPFIAIMFVIETLSVIIQVASKKFRGKKVFYIAPLHHHFEYEGWPESKVTMRFWIIGCFFAALGVILEMLTMIGGA